MLPLLVFQKLHPETPIKASSVQRLFWRAYCLDLYMRASPKPWNCHSPLKTHPCVCRGHAGREEDAEQDLSCPFTSPLPAALNVGSPSLPLFAISKENLLLHQETCNLSGLLNLFPNGAQTAFNNHHL